jgi:hypothetical protein
MPEMDWHDSVLLELRRTRAAAEKIAALLEEMRPANKKEIAAQIAFAERMAGVNDPSKSATSYADWRRAAAYNDTPMGIEQERFNRNNQDIRVGGPVVSK